MKLKIGDKAPAINLPDKDGKMHKLSDFNGKWVLVYFYPRDNTPGCTKEACAMRDNQASYKKAGAVVIGISTDSQRSHAKFIAKHDLPFLLLADEEKKTVRDYGVWGKKKFMGREFNGTKRMSFLIDPKGEVVKVYEKVKPAEHAQEVLDDISTYS